MKKLSLLFVIFSTICQAQNYQCLQNGAKSYFINSNGYLRGISIDSVKTYPDSVVYYPFHTPRGAYDFSKTTVLDSNGGSWLGKRVNQLTDGTFLFDNIWGDTIIVKTQSYVGDSWIFCRDTTSLYYLATCIGVDTMTIHGSADSVKKIMITARSSSGIVTSDPADSFQIILTKNNGFAQVFDLYTFPYHKPDSAYRPGLDYFLDASLRVLTTYTIAQNPLNYSTGIFRLIDLVNPTQKKLSDFQPADVYEYKYCGSNDYSCTSIPDHYIIDSVISQVNIGDTTIDSIYSIITSLSFTNVYTTQYISTSIRLYNNLLIDTLLMPEEPGELNAYFYYPDNTDYCITGPLYRITGNDLDAHSTLPAMFEPSYGIDNYKLGLGLVNSWTQQTGDTRFDDQEQIYYRRSGTSCGNYLFLDVPVIARETTFHLYPNPARNELTITSSCQIRDVAITNVIGQVIVTDLYNSNKINIDVRNLSPGVYFVRINGLETRKFLKE